MRGFGYHGVYVLEPTGELDAEGNPVLVEAGGNTMAQFNAEIITPLFPDQGIYGVLFYDIGNVYSGEIDLTDMRQSAGIGVRWLSPLAPMQFIYGEILDRREGESSGRFEFSMGGSF